MSSQEIELIINEIGNWSPKEMIEYIDNCDTWDDPKELALIHWLTERYDIDESSSNIEDNMDKIRKAVSAERRELTKLAEQLRNTKQ